jgi:hypothetical protein
VGIEKMISSNAPSKPVPSFVPLVENPPSDLSPAQAISTSMEAPARPWIGGTMKMINVRVPMVIPTPN